MSWPWLLRNRLQIRGRRGRGPRDEPPGSGATYPIARAAHNDGAESADLWSDGGERTVLRTPARSGAVTLAALYRVDRAPGKQAGR